MWPKHLWAQGWSRAGAWMSKLMRELQPGVPVRQGHTVGGALVTSLPSSRTPGEGDSLLAPWLKRMPLSQFLLEFKQEQLLRSDEFPGLALDRVTQRRFFVPTAGGMAVEGLWWGDPAWLAGLWNGASGSVLMPQVTAL